jgi:hypothetical protein
MNVQEGAYRPRLPQFLKGQKRRRSDGPDREQAECQGQSAEFEAESHGSLLTMPLTGPLRSSQQEQRCVLLFLHEHGSKPA